jgi:nicotinate-nucleotide adenylyltransferase
MIIKKPVNWLSHARYNKGMAKQRIGIFAGTFDPVHTGHLSFVLQAIKEAKLDHVYFLPERRPRYKPNVEHFGHRTAMITRAIRPHKELSLLELPDIYFDVKRTLPKLKQEFKGATLVFLMGSDTLMALSEWPEIDTLLNTVEIVTALRAGHDKAVVLAEFARLSKRSRLHVIDSPAEHVSSSRIRYAVRHNLPVAGLLASVYRYARANWLYVSVAVD